MNNRLFVDFHVLQTVPPSCVNRDDTGRPKTAMYGGTPRARVSSQCSKRGISQYFIAHFPEYSVGERTRHVRDLLTDNILILDPSMDEEKANEKAKKALEKLGLKGETAADQEKDKGKDKDQNTLYFVTTDQIKALAEVAVSGETQKAKYIEALNSKPSIDMVMFGRMIASEPSLNYDATVQVAHSISTHTVHNEFDFFTAIDDEDPYKRAGHLNTTEFNSSTLYRFATMNVADFWKFDDYHSAEAVTAFAKAFVYSMPTGKINTFANFTLPDDVYITVRTDQPVNLCGAFERPVRSKGEGYVEPSEQAFTDYTKKIYANFSGDPIAAFGAGTGMAALADTKPMPQVFDNLQNCLDEILRSQK